MTDKKRTAVASSVGADERQSFSNKVVNIIPNPSSEINLQVVKSLESEPFEGLKTISMTELYDTAYKQRTPVVEGILSSGMYLFVGAPKIGKSFFVAQLGYHVSRGIPLWERDVKQGTVLYLALEDDYPRLQSRLSTMFGVEENDNFFFSTRSKVLADGLEEQLRSFIETHPETRLIIIDTLQKIRDVGGEKYSYASDYMIVNRLKEFSDQYDVCMIVVHHTRKMEAQDSFEMISGTNGLLGAADGAVVIHKDKRTENRAVMEIVGRDQPEQKLILKFNRQCLLWELEEQETELWIEPPDPILEKVSSILSAQSPYWKGSATELLELLPELDMQPNVLTRKLNVGAGKLLNEYGIRYESTRTHSGRIIQLMLNEM